MKKITFSLTVLTLMAFGLSSFAQTQNELVNLNDKAFNDKYYSFKKPVVTLVEVKDKKSLLNKDLPSTASLEMTTPESLDGVSPMEIINILFKVWDIIEKNKPVVNVKTKFANAVPASAGGQWDALVGWKPERSFKYNVTYQNGFGMNVIDFEYQVKLIYGGQYQGKGLYIASARVMPTKVKVLWGFNLDVNVEVPVVLNVGTAEDPIAAIQMDINWRAKSMFKDEAITESYQLQGDGVMIDTKNATEIFGKSKKLTKSYQVQY